MLPYQSLIQSNQSASLSRDDSENDN